MKRVLVTGASNIGKAGVATMVYNWGQNFEEGDIVYDYLSQRGFPEKQYIDAIKKQNGRIYVPNKLSKNMVVKNMQIIKWIFHVLKSGKYEHIHINSDTSYLATIYFLIAKFAKVNNIIVHSHSTMVDEKSKLKRIVKVALHYFFRPWVKKANGKLACSTAAGVWMFGKGERVAVIPNGVCLDKYKFSKENRIKHRELMGIEEELVIGCVGRLAYQKNCLMTIEIFEEMIKVRPNTILWFIGEGPLREELQTYISQKHLSDKCFLFGNRDDVDELMSAMDLFLLPSRFEGLGIVYIEAQASGMPVFASDCVPDEAFATDLIHKISISSSPKVWADECLKYCNQERKDVCRELEIKGYCIKSSAKILKKIYL